MIFLIKCVACIALVLFALGWPGGDAPAPASETRTRIAAPKPPRRPQIEDSARELAQAGTDALFAAARDRCLSSPRDCAAVLQRFQGAGRER